MCAYSTCLIYLYLTLHPSTSKILLVILLTVCHTILLFELGEFGIRSTNHLLIDVFLHSHHLSAWYCIDIVMRKSVLVTNKGWKFKIWYFPVLSHLTKIAWKWFKYCKYVINDMEKSLLLLKSLFHIFWFSYNFCCFEWRTRIYTVVLQINLKKLLH